MKKKKEQIQEEVKNVPEIAPSAEETKAFLWISDVLHGSPAYEAGL